MSLVQQITDKIRHEVQKAVVGQQDTLDLLLVGLLSGGNILLEDVPGIGKTVLAKTLSASIGCKYSRIQCTPDLLPSDVVGNMIFNQKTEDFEFREGPLFSQLVLVDEINRAIPRTQSALLEAMAEGQITVDGKSRQLERPFFLIATQNPLESHGTFPLPEAQLDRFQMKLSLGYPDLENERKILRLARVPEPVKEVFSVVTPADIVMAQEELRSIYIHEEVENYMLDIVRMTREYEGVLLGVSPRALIALGSAAQALAAIRGRDYVIPDDVKYLAPKVFSHRLVLDSSLRMKQIKPETIIREILEQIPVPVEVVGK